MPGKRGPMRGVVLTAMVLGLSACASAGEVTGSDALSGQPLEAAISLYGPYENFLVLDGRPTYIWRRRYEAEGKEYFCELRAEMGFRRQISRSLMQGFPDACRLFSVRFQYAPAVRQSDAGRTTTR